MPNWYAILTAIAAALAFVAAFLDMSYPIPGWPFAVASGAITAALAAYHATGGDPRPPQPPPSP